MKRDASRSGFTTIEHKSVTVFQMSRDITGRQTIDRTYTSTKREINQLDENSSSLMLKDASEIETNMIPNRGEERKPIEKFVQLSLFPISEL